MKKFFAITLAFVLLLSLTACDDTWHSDFANDAYAFVTTSTGESFTLRAVTYINENFTAHSRAINSPYSVYLEEGDTATIVFACTACGHTETFEDVQAPWAKFFECQCVTGDHDPAMTECLVINVILGTPPAEEG